ncbi:hypothetical protein SteCoe_16389 [Stentor coeruleus]|uniref:LITAF domain-containing protein n=1 Tax=Stentor coeruleus TaxID=5963 RepID=A0A1R2C190_9CILI|nr:hypothetical protein SteCoe_16389 [Stentor coeruleus]
MIPDFKTPEKEPQDPQNDTLSTVKRDNGLIFSNSTTKFRRSCLSERRYSSQKPNKFDTIDIISEDQDSEIKSSKLLTYEPKHIKKISHIRQKSITYTEEMLVLDIPKEPSTRNTSKVLSVFTENSRCPSHLRNASDADSVVYVAAEDLKKGSIDMKIGLSESGKENTCDSVRSSLIVLENSPCSVYCRYCKTDVHTAIEFYNTRVPGRFLRIFSSIFTCCSGPLWLNNYKVHKCPHCSLVLAKCR